MFRLQDIQQVHLEITTKCNARCPMCPRNYRGGDYNTGYPVTELSLNDIKKIFTLDFLAQLNRILINGNLGDFSLAKDARSITEYFVEHGQNIIISTNGSTRTSAWWADLALPGVEIHFALDGLSGTHEHYRLDTDWNKVIENAQAFISQGGHAVWKFIEFEHNRHELQACRKLAESLGFARFDVIHGGRDTGPVYTRDGNYSHHLGQVNHSYRPSWKILLQDHLDWFDPSTVKHDRDTNPLDLRCEHLARREIYIAADGSVYPCCYLGFYPKSMCQPGNLQIREIVWENNALENDLSHCLEWFDRVEQSWHQPDIASGRLFTCVARCSR